MQKPAEEFEAIKNNYYNSDIEIRFNYSNNNFRESYHKQKVNYEQFAKMFSVFDGIIENAIGIEVHKQEGYKPDPTLDNVYVLISAFEDGNNIIPVKLEIKEFSDKANSLYVAITLEGIKKAEVSKQGTTENGVAQNSRSAIISIADLMRKINLNNTNFTKYFPKEFMTDEQIEVLQKTEELQKAQSGSVFSARDVYNVLDIETRADLADHILRYIDDEGEYRAGSNLLYHTFHNMKKCYFAENASLLIPYSLLLFTSEKSQGHLSEE